MLEYITPVNVIYKLRTQTVEFLTQGHVPHSHTSENRPQIPNIKTVIGSIVLII